MSESFLNDYIDKGKQNTRLEKLLSICRVVAMQNIATRGLISSISAVC